MSENLPKQIDVLYPKINALFDKNKECVAICYIVDKKTLERIRAGENVSDEKLCAVLVYSDADPELLKILATATRGALKREF